MNGYSDTIGDFSASSGAVSKSKSGFDEVMDRLGASSEERAMARDFCFIKNPNYAPHAFHDDRATEIYQKIKAIMEEGPTEEFLKNRSRNPSPWMVGATRRMDAVLGSIIRMLQYALVAILAEGKRGKQDKPPLRTRIRNKLESWKKTLDVMQKGC